MTLGGYFRTFVVAFGADNPHGFSVYEATNRSEAAKNLLLMQRHFADIVRCVAISNIYLIRKALSGFLVTRRQMALKAIWVYNVRKLHQPRMSDAFLADTVDMYLTIV